MKWFLVLLMSTNTPVANVELGQWFVNNGWGGVVRNTEVECFEQEMKARDAFEVYKLTNPMLPDDLKFFAKCVPLELE